MKRSRKFTTLLLVACMSFTWITGCGNTKTVTNESTGMPDTTNGQQEGTAQKNPAEFDTSEHVVLTMYCIGDEGGIYAEDHLKAVNELLTEKINAEIEPIMVSWGDYRTKLPMIWASGESYDMTYIANWIGYFNEADRGAFMDITELFPTYAPLTYAECEANNYLETIKVNDKIYMVPKQMSEYTSFIYNYREDLRQKYNCPEIVDIETFETYLDAIVKNEPGMIPFINNSSKPLRFQAFLNDMDWSRPIEYDQGFFSYDLKDPTHVFNIIETPEYEEFVKKSREYYEKGYWSKSIMAETNSPRESFEAGAAASYLDNIPTSNNAYLNIKAGHPDWITGYLSTDIASGMTEQVAASNNGIAIGAYSRNPERAMMFLELMYQDEEVYRVVMDGLEGITYEKDEETMTKWTPEGANETEIGLKNLQMGFGTSKFNLTSKDENPRITEMIEEYAKVSVIPGLSGFALSQDEISAELAALKSVISEYKVPLEMGVVDPEEGLIQLKAKMKEAGAEKVMDEINKQIAAYLK